MRGATAGSTAPNQPGVDRLRPGGDLDRGRRARPATGRGLVRRVDARPQVEVQQPRLPRDVRARRPAALAPSSSSTCEPLRHVDHAVVGGDAAGSPRAAAHAAASRTAPSTRLEQVRPGARGPAVPVRGDVELRDVAVGDAAVRGRGAPSNAAVEPVLERRGRRRTCAAEHLPGEAGGRVVPRPDRERARRPRRRPARRRVRARCQPSGSVGVEAAQLVHDPVGGGVERGVARPRRARPGIDARREGRERRGRGRRACRSRSAAGRRRQRAARARPAPAAPRRRARRRAAPRPRRRGGRPSAFRLPRTASRAPGEHVAERGSRRSATMGATIRQCAIRAHASRGTGRPAGIASAEQRLGRALGARTLREGLVDEHAPSRTSPASASRTSTSRARCRAPSSSTPTRSSTPAPCPTPATASSRCSAGSSTRWPTWASAPTAAT